MSQDLYHQHFFTYTLHDWLDKMSVKCIVISLYLSYVFVAIFGCWNMNRGLQLSHVAPDNSYVRGFYKAHNHYFKTWTITIFVEGRFVPWDEDEWTTMSEIVHKFENDTSVVGSAASWTYRFDEYLGNRTVQQSNFTQAFDAFLSHPAYASHALDIVWNIDKSAIVATRFYLTYTPNATDAKITDLVEIMVRLREIAQSIDHFEVIVFSKLFVYLDTVRTELPEALKEIGVGIAVSFIVSLILLPDAYYSILIALCMMSISVGVMGFRRVIGINFNYFGMVLNLVCVGSCIDNSVHVLHSFLATAAEDSDYPRMRMTMRLTGYPIWQGVTANILSCICVYFGPFEIFRTFVLLTVMALFFAVAHGLVLLPVLLFLLHPTMPKEMPPVFMTTTEFGERSMDTTTTLYLSRGSVRPEPSVLFPQSSHESRTSSILKRYTDKVHKN